MRFPVLIEFVEKYIGHPLPYREEIISINKIRNRLVHREGLVSDIDIRNKSNEELEMKWISLKWYTKINEVLTEITYDLRKEGLNVNNLTYKVVDNKKTFKLGQKITIDINEFNGIAYTCAEFAQYIYSSMPKPGNNNGL